MKISSAEFITSINGEHELMKDPAMQIVLVGRSNVGKSSVINTLVGMRNLARTSDSPGRTKRIYFYLINRAFYLVDIPGYGYAKLSKTTKKQMSELLTWYLNYEEFGVRKYVLVVDVKVGPSPDDVRVMSMLKSMNKQVIVAANKLDKIATSKRFEKLNRIQVALDTKKVIGFSAISQMGREEMWKELNCFD